MAIRITQKAGVGTLPITFTEPTQPTGLVLFGVTDTTASLRCNPSFPTDSTYIKAYRWYVDGAEYVDSLGPTVTLTGLTQATDYWVGVSAITSQNVESEQADSILVTTEATADPEVPATAPTAPGSVTEYASPADYTAFRWTASQSTDEYPLIGYKVSRDGAPGIPTTKLYWIDEGVSPNTTYNYQVWSYTAAAESAKVSISITTDAVTQNVFAFLPISVPTGYRASQTVPQWTIGTVNGQGTVTVSLQSGSLAPGMTVLPDGTVPAVLLPSTARGTYNAVIAATDNTQTITTNVQIVIGYGLLTITVNSAPPSAVDGDAYSLQGIGYITLSGGDGVYGLSVRSGTYLPGNLSLGMVGGDDAVWDVSGTCNGVSGQTYTAILDATSTDSQTASYSLVVPVQAVAPLPFDIVLDALPNFTVSSSYSTKNLTITGRIGTVTVTRSGAVPAGWTASTSQSAASNTFPMFSGTATEGYGLTYSGTITASDDGTTPPRTKTIPYSVSGNPAVATGVTITMPTFTNAVPGSSYSKTVTITGGTAGQTFGTVTGTLPPGISITPDNVTAATSWTYTATSVSNTAAGTTYSGQFRVYDAATGLTTSAPWQITVEPLSTAFVAPSQTNPLPDFAFTGGAVETIEYDTADYVDAGDATDLVITVEPYGQLPWPGGIIIDTNGTGIGGKIRGTNNGFLNPTVDLDVPDSYRLKLAYTDPGNGPPGGPSTPESDWIARSTGSGVDYADDFRGFASTNELRAAAPTNAYSAGQFAIFLNTTDALTGGKCLEIQTYDGAGQQGGSHSFTFPTGLTEFYFQFSVWMNEEALYWVNLDGDPSKKFCNIGTYNSGRQVALTNRSNYGFCTAFLNGGSAMERTVSASITGALVDYFYQTGVDSGVAGVSGDQKSWIRKFGPSYRLQKTLYDYAYKTSGSGTSNYVNRRGFAVPDVDAIQSGAVPFVMNGWTTIEVYVKNSTTDAQDVVRVWAAPYGSAPKKILDNNPGGLGTVANNYLRNTDDLTYQTVEFLNYPTGRSPEPGYRPTQIQRYDQRIRSTRWIPFPNHLTGTEP